MATTTGKRFIIRSGIPMPIARRPDVQKTKYPFRRMKPGDSFGFPKKMATSVRRSLEKRRKHYPEMAEWKFRVMQYRGDSFRCWRIK